MNEKERLHAMNEGLKKALRGTTPWFVFCPAGEDGELVLAFHKTRSEVNRAVQELRGAAKKKVFEVGEVVEDDVGARFVTDDEPQKTLAKALKTTLKGKLPAARKLQAMSREEHEADVPKASQDLRIRFGAVSGQAKGLIAQVEEEADHLRVLVVDDAPEGHGDRRQALVDVLPKLAEAPEGLRQAAKVAQEAVKGLGGNAAEAVAALEERVARVAARLAKVQEARKAYEAVLPDEGPTTDSFEGSRFSLRKRGKEYEGEEHKTGRWRAKDEEDIGSSRITTKTFTEDERERSEVNRRPGGKLEGGTQFNPDGTVRGSTDQLLDTRSTEDEEGVGYVMDKDGQLHQFQGGIREERSGGYGGAKSVVSLKSTHHSSVVGGDDVVGAGTFKARDGVLTEITNASGHYKPQVRHLLQTVEELLRTGALLDQDIVDKKGKPLKTSHPAYKLVEQMNECQRILRWSRGVLEDLRGEDVEDEKVEELARKIREVSDARLDAMRALEKSGFRVKNTLRDTKVVAIQGTEKKTGAGVHEALDEARTSGVDVETFLTTGGSTGDEAQRVKEQRGSLLDELREKTKKTRRKLDTEARARRDAWTEEVGRMRTRLTELTQRIEEGGDGAEALKAEHERLTKALARLDGPEKITDFEAETKKLKKLWKELDELGDRANELL